MQSSKVYNNEDLNHIGAYYNHVLKTVFDELKWKITLNFALAKETPFDIETLKEQFSTEDFFVKISPVNENEVSEENNLHTLIQNVNLI